jgi:hypothetical protein
MNRTWSVYWLACTPLNGSLQLAQSEEEWSAFVVAMGGCQSGFDAVEF